MTLENWEKLKRSIGRTFNSSFWDFVPTVSKCKGYRLNWVNGIIVITKSTPGQTDDKTMGKIEVAPDVSFAHIATAIIDDVCYIGCLYARCISIYKWCINDEKSTVNSSLVFTSVTDLDCVDTLKIEIDTHTKQLNTTRANITCRSFKFV